MFFTARFNGTIHFRDLVEQNDADRNFTNKYSIWTVIQICASTSHAIWTGPSSNVVTDGPTSPAFVRK